MMLKFQQSLAFKKKQSSPVLPFGHSFILNVMFIYLAFKKKQSSPVLLFWHSFILNVMFIYPPSHVMWCVDKWKSVALLAAHMLEIQREELPTKMMMICLDTKMGFQGQL